MITSLERQKGVVDQKNRQQVLMERHLPLMEMGPCFGADLYQKKVDYLIEHEWARTVETFYGVVRNLV